MSQPLEPGAPSVEAAEGEGGLAATRVRDLLGLLVKTLRAYQMYQANNPVYERFLVSLRAGFQGIWEFVPSLHIQVEETGFRWQDEAFAIGGGRDGLAFQFYKDGVRYLTFLPGFEDELESFLAVLIRARWLTPAEEDDLVTLLWEQEFTAFQYGYVDVLAEGLVLPAGEQRFDPVSSERLAEEAASAGGPGAAEAGGPGSAASAPPAFTPDDFNETLYFLDEEELDRLAQELDDEWIRDLKADVLNALFDRLEDPIPDRQTEILGVLRQLLPVYLARGDLVSATRILHELDVLLDRGDVLGAAQRALADGLFEELSEPVVLGQLLQALEDGGVDPKSEDLSLFLLHLRPAALPVLFRALETSTSGEVRERVQPAADRLAAQHPGVVAELLASEDDAVAVGAARSTGRLRLEGVTAALVRLLDRVEPPTRLAAVEALVAMGSIPSLDGLQRALEDEAREVRIAAARGLGSRQHAPALARVGALIQGRALRDADLTEKLAFFEAYADLGSERAIEVLDHMLNGRGGLLGRRLPAELRACAATALGRIGTPAARESLQRAAGETDTIVRSAVTRALRREAAAP